MWLIFGLSTLLELFLLFMLTELLPLDVKYAFWRVVVGIVKPYPSVHHWNPCLGGSIPIHIRCSWVPKRQEILRRWILYHYDQLFRLHAIRCHKEKRFLPSNHRNCKKVAEGWTVMTCDQRNGWFATVHPTQYSGDQKYCTVTWPHIKIDLQSEGGIETLQKMHVTHS